MNNKKEAWDRATIYMFLFFSINCTSFLLKQKMWFRCKRVPLSRCSKLMRHLSLALQKNTLETKIFFIYLKTKDLLLFTTFVVFNIFCAIHFHICLSWYWLIFYAEHQTFSLLWDEKFKKHKRWIHQFYSQTRIYFLMTYRMIIDFKVRWIV